jgi:hypothetical protein
MEYNCLWYYKKGNGFLLGQLIHKIGNYWLVIPNYSILNYSNTRNLFNKDPGYPGDSNSSCLSVYLSVCLSPSLTLPLSLYLTISLFSLSFFCLQFRFRLDLSSIKNLGIPKRHAFENWSKTRNWFCNKSN